MTGDWKDWMRWFAVSCLNKFHENLPDGATKPVSLAKLNLMIKFEHGSYIEAEFLLPENIKSKGILQCLIIVLYY